MAPRKPRGNSRSRCSPSKKGKFTAAAEMSGSYPIPDVAHARNALAAHRRQPGAGQVAPSLRQVPAARKNAKKGGK